MNKRALLRQGYTINHTSVGWWVDGACGYKVSEDYADSEADAIASAVAAIKNATANNERPVWLFNW